MLGPAPEQIGKHEMAYLLYYPTTVATVILATIGTYALG